MASRAIVIRYNVDVLDPSGDVVLEIKAIFADTIDKSLTKVLMASAVLDVSNPATWKASIAAALVEAGINQGFVDLTALGVFAPTYSN